MYIAFKWTNSSHIYKYHLLILAFLTPFLLFAVFYHSLNSFVLNHFAAHNLSNLIDINSLLNLNASLNPHFAKSPSAAF